MKKLLLMILTLAMVFCAGVAFGASTNDTITLTVTPGEEDEEARIFDTIQAALDYAGNEQEDDDGNTFGPFPVVTINITDDLDEDGVGDIAEYLTDDYEFTQIILQGKGGKKTITSPSEARHFVVNRSRLTLTLNSLTLAGNEDDGGGGVWLQNGNLEATDVTFTGNDAGALGELDEDEEPDAASDYTGGAVHITGRTATAAFTNCTFTGNSSSMGGAIHAQAGTITLSGGSFTNNGQATDNTETPEYGGAIYIAADASVTVDGNFSGNTAAISGGAIYSANALTLSGGTFTGNTAGTSGGAIYSENSQLTITGGTFSGNTAGSYGGAVHAENSTASISGATFDNSQGANSAANGGAVSISGGSLSTANTTFSNNSADLGGALYAGGAVTFGDGVTFRANKANNGGALYIPADAEVSSTGSVSFTGNTAINGGAVWAISGSSVNGLASAVTFSGNTADYGGALYVYEQSSTLVLDTTKPWGFTGNTANYDGGAIFTLSADVLIDGLTIEGTSANTAIQGGGFLRSGGITTIRNGASISGQSAHFGGAVYSVGDVSISNSTFTRNSATATSGNINGGGGAVYVQGSITVSSSDFSSNTSTTTFRNQGGGAIFVSGDATIEGSEFTGNIHQNSAATDTNGGGAIYAKGTLTITSSIFTSNSAAGSSSSRGGAIYADSSNVAITDSLFQNNRSAHNGGAAVFSGEGTSTITRSTFTENVSSGGNGGAVYAQGNSSVKESYFYLNRAFAYGGAVYFNQHNNANYGSFSAEVCYFAQNSAGIAPSQNGYGGALYLSPEIANINRCTFDSNQVSSSNGQSYGGAVYVDVSDSISATISAIKNSVFFGNNASDGATNYGGAVYTKGAVSIISSTIASNTASGSSSRGGGVYADIGTLTITATIVVGNTGNIGRDVYAEGTITSRGYNRIGVYGKGGSNTSWLADVSGSNTDRENSAWSTATFFGSDAQLVTEYEGYTIPTVGESTNPVLLPALPLNEDETLPQADRATNMIPFARRYTLNIEQTDIWGLNRFASGTDISIGAVLFGGEGGGSQGTEEGSFDIASITMSGIPNTLKYPGQTASLIALIRYTNGRTAYGVPASAASITVNQQERVIWSSSNNNTVKIDQNGNITALRATSGTSGVTISVETVRYTLGGTPAKTSRNIIVTDNNGYDYMNISPEYYNYLTQNVYPNLFEYDISAAIADKNPSTVRSSTFQRNFSGVWSASASQITELTTSTPTIAPSTNAPVISGMSASKAAGVSINYQGRTTGELFPVIYSWTLTGDEVRAVMGYDMSSKNIGSTLAGEVFEKFSIVYQGNNQVIPVVGGSGVSGKDAYDYGALELSKADGNTGLHVDLTAYVGNMAVTGSSDGAQVVRSSGTSRLLVVPDGAADGAIAGAMWMMQPAGTAPNTTPNTSPNTGTNTSPNTGTNSNATSGGSGGGGGCDAMSAGLVAAIVFFLKRKR